MKSCFRCVGASTCRKPEGRRQSWRRRIFACFVCQCAQTAESFKL